MSNHTNRSRATRSGASPKPEEILQLRKDREESRKNFGAWVYADARTVEAWEQGLRRMPGIKWELLCLIQAYPEVERAVKLWRQGRAV